MGSINMALSDIMRDPVDRAIEDNPLSSLANIGSLGRPESRSDTNDESQSVLVQNRESNVSALPSGPEYFSPLDTFELSQNPLNNFAQSGESEGYSALPKGVLYQNSALPQAPEANSGGGLQGPAFSPIGLDGPLAKPAEPEEEQEEEEDTKEEEEARTTEEQLLGARDDFNMAEQRELRSLRRADQEVRAHEQAHRSVGGQFIRGGVQFEYQKGPDGKLYAVGGEVSIDVSDVPNDPEATARKMEKVRRAALAPSNPSPQDRLVAAKAASTASLARAEAAQQRAEELRLQQEETGISRGNEGPLGPILGETQTVEVGMFIDLLY